MRKIILVGILPPPYNGQSVAFKVLADKVKETGIRNSVVNISVSNNLSFKYLDKPSRVLDFLIVFNKLFAACLFSKNLVYVQISQSSNGFKRDKLINRIAKLFNSKIIAHMHGGNYNGFYDSQNEQMKKNIAKELLNYDKIVVLSENLRNMYAFQPAISNRVVSVPNGVRKAVDQPSGKSLCTVLKGEGTLNILYLSNLIESKGYLEVLESLKILKAKQVNFKAYFCGKFYQTDEPSVYKSVEEAKSDFFSRIEEYDLVDRVIYKGVVIGNEKESLLKDAHFFVLPTRYNNEGQPISIIEAMREGCVVISSNYRAIPDMIENRVTGFLLDMISPQNIAGCITECIQDPHLFSQISSKAIHFYNENFTEDIHCSRMLSLLEECSAS